MMARDSAGVGKRRMERLRDEIDELGRERTRGAIAMAAAVALMGWMSYGLTVSRTAVLLTVGIFVLGAIHQQLCHRRIDALHRTMREAFPGLSRS